MAQFNFGGVVEDVITSEEFSLQKARANRLPSGPQSSPENDQRVVQIRDFRWSLSAEK